MLNPLLIQDNNPGNIKPIKRVGTIQGNFAKFQNFSHGQKINDLRISTPKIKNLSSKAVLPTNNIKILGYFADATRSGSWPLTPKYAIFLGLIPNSTIGTHSVPLVLVITSFQRYLGRQIRFLGSTIVYHSFHMP